jgi:NitT/TauT family transport system substrate-binding protein
MMLVKPTIMLGRRAQRGASKHWATPVLRYAIALCVIAFSTNGWAEPVKLRISFAATSQYVPLIPLAPKELYKHYGKTYVVEPVFIAGSGPAMTALAAGELALGALGPQSFANAMIEAKLDLRGVAQVLTTDYPGYTGGQYWCRAPIAKVEDMVGKTVAINARGSAPDAALRAHMTKHGVKDTNYQVIEMPFPAALPALLSKRVDCAVLVAPWQFQMVGKPDFHKVFALADVLGPSETAVWTATTEFVAKNRAVLVDFVEDHIRFRRWTLDPKTHPEAVKLAAQHDKRPPEDLAWIFTTRDNYHHPDAKIDVARFQKNLDDLHRLGVTPGTIDAKKHIDSTIVEDALKRLKTN